MITPTSTSTGTTERAFTSRNPAQPSDTVGTFTISSVADVDAVVDAAVEAQAAWVARPVSERATVVGGIAHALARELHTLSSLVTREEGKPIGTSEDEVRKAAEQFHFASQLAYQSEGTTYPAESPGVFAHTLRAPVGVVVAITPWNFPLSLPARKLAPALAVGNAVIFKPSPATAATGEFLVQLCREAGLPTGLLQSIQGDDSQTMAALLGHLQVNAITFTGSDRVGELVRLQAHGHARLQAELGGHNGVLVCADADLELAAKEVVAGAFSLTGQACTASARVMVEHSAHDELAELIASGVRRMVVGPGDRAGVTCGPVATRGQYERLHALRQSAIDAGHLLAEGQLADGLDPEGFWTVPAAIAELPPDHPVNAAEVFGPLLSLIAVDGPDDAIDMLNVSRHGLVAAVHTSDLGVAHRFSRAVRCGIIKVNQRTTGNGIAPPFGGWKASRVGSLPEGGRHAVDFFTDTKTVYLRY